MCRAFEELFEQGIEQGAMKEKMNSVKNLMDTTKWTLDEVLVALKFTDSEKEYILENIDK